MAYYTNQWLGDSTGKWHAVTGAKYTGDETARKNYRKDYSGGLKDGRLYLRNGGFFDDLTPLNQKLEYKTSLHPPMIDFNKLPR